MKWTFTSAALPSLTWTRLFPLELLLLKLEREKNTSLKSCSSARAQSHYIFMFLIYIYKYIYSLYVIWSDFWSSRIIRDRVFSWKTECFWLWSYRITSPAALPRNQILVSVFLHLASFSVPDSVITDFMKSQVEWCTRCHDWIHLTHTKTKILPETSALTHIIPFTFHIFLLPFTALYFSFFSFSLVILYWHDL